MPMAKKVFEKLIMILQYFEFFLVAVSQTVMPFDCVCSLQELIRTSEACGSTFSTLRPTIDIQD
jgi:hypothetical protein